MLDLRRGNEVRGPLRLLRCVEFVRLRVCFGEVLRLGRGESVGDDRHYANSSLKYGENG